MDEVLSPMVEMSVKRSREYPAEENRFSNTSTDYTDEVIQDFRMSIAMPVLPVIGHEARAVAPEQTTFMRLMHGHTKCVRAMAVYTPTNGDPALLVTSGDDGVTIVWDLQTFTVIHRLEGVHTHRIRGLAVYTPAEPPAKSDTKPAPMHHTINIHETINRSALHASVTDLYTRPLIITGSDDKSAAVWDLTSGTLIRHLTGGHKWFIMSVSVLMPTYGTSPFVVTSGWDNYSIVWNVSTGQQIMRLSSEHANAVSAVVAFVSPQLQSEIGRNLCESARVPFILTAGFDRIISIWDGESGQLLRTYPTKHTDIVSCAAVYTPHHSEHGLYALTGSFDGTAISYNLLNGQMIRVLGGHSDWVTSVAMFRTNSGKPFFALGLTGCQDGTAVLWDLVYGIAIRKFEQVHTMPVTSVQFVARSVQQGSSSTSAFDKGLRNCSMFYPVGGGTDAATGGSGGGIINTAHAAHKSSINTSTTATTTASTTTDDPYSQHFPHILTGSEDQRVVLWNLDSAQCVKFDKRIPTTYNTTAKNASHSPSGTRASDPGVSKDWIVCMKIFAPTDGRRPILITGSTNHTITVYDVLTNSVIKVLYGHSGDVSGVDVFECSHEKYVKLHEQCISEYGVINTNSGIHSPTTSTKANDTNASGTANALRTCASTDTSVLLIVSGSHDSTAVVWDYDTARPLHTLHTAHKENISSVAVCAEYGMVQCAVLVLCSYDSTATVYDLYTNTILHTLADAHTDGITNCTIYKPLLHTLESRPLLITTGIDGTAVVWDVCSGEYVRTLAGGHRERVKSVATYECPHNSIEPIVITGGYDKRAVVWSLRTGALLRVLEGVHRNWVTAVAVVQPNESTSGGADSGREGRPQLVHSDRKANIASNPSRNTTHTSTATNSTRGAPFIVTAGFDGVPALWDLRSGLLISRLEGGGGAATSGVSGSVGVSGGVRYGTGIYDTVSTKTSAKHTTNSAPTAASNSGSSGIRCLAVYTGIPLDHGRLSPLVFTAGHDGAVTQHDTCYPFHTMPPKATVLSLFHIDAVESPDKSWPRVTALSERFQQCLWMENSALFVLACTTRRSDFLLKFQSMLGVMLPRMGNIVESKSLLRYCVENKDLQCTRVLLSAWSGLLNTHIGSKMIMKVHPSMYLHPAELLLLGSVYPAEFTLFIRSIRLVSVDFGVSMCSIGGSNSVGGGSSVTAGCSLQQVTDPYKLFDVCEYGSEHSAQPVTLCYLPLHQAASLDMLYMYLQTSIVLNSVEIFDTDVVVYALRYAWSYFAYNVHIRSTAMFALFMLLYTPTMLCFESLTQSSDAADVNFGWFLQSITFVSFVCRMAYTVYKSTRIVHTYSECIAYISDPWVVLDLLTQVLGMVGLSARYVLWGESDVSRGFLSPTTVLLWFRGLYYLRPFRASGPLVSMVLAIACNMRVFVLIMIMALFGFSQGFWLISHRGDHLPFGTVQRSMLSAFNYMMGSFDTEFEGNRLPVVGTFLVIIFVVFVIILMLNLLIALMGNTFSMVSEKGLAQWRQEQVSIVLEERLVGGVAVPPCLFVLMSTTAFEEYVEGRDQVDMAHKNSAVYGSSGSGGSDKTNGSGSDKGNDVGGSNRSVDSVVLDKVRNLESRIDNLVSKLDYIASKME